MTTFKKSLASRVNFKRSMLSCKHNQGTFINYTAGPQCASFLCNLEAIPSYVRLVHLNDQTGATWTVGGAAIAPTTQRGVQADDGYNPYNAAGAQDNTLWSSVTYNNAGANTDLFSQASGSTATLTVPVAPVSAGQPAQAFSDWMPVTGLPRIDGGVGSLLLVRVYSAGNIRFNGNVPGSNPVTYNNRQFAAYYKSGGNYTTSGNYSGFTSPSAILFGDPGLQYIAAGKGLTIVSISDSIGMGIGTTDSNLGYGWVAATSLSSAGLPVSFWNDGYSGRVSADSHTDGYNTIKNLKPQVALIMMFSGNDTITNAGAATAFQRGMALADYAISQNCRPILVTYPPRYSTDPTSDAARRYSNGLVRAAGAIGYDVLDLDLLMGTGAVPNAYISGYGYTDGVHMSVLGHQVAGAALAAMLQPAFA